MMIQALCHCRSSTMINNTDIKVVVENILKIIYMQGECVNIFSRTNSAIRASMPTKKPVLKNK